MLATRLLIICLVTLLVTACAGPDLQSYRDQTPEFDPSTFFQGKLDAHGVVKNRSGEVIRHFSATIDASWNDGIGTLKERFEFDDGEIQFRNWTLTPTGTSEQGEQLFDATAGDVVGTGKGRYLGNALNLKYTLQIDYQGDPLNVDVDDWMWQVNDNVIINESTMRKWGFKVGSVQLVIRKLDE